MKKIKQSSLFSWKKRRGMPNIGVVEPIAAGLKAASVKFALGEGKR